MNQPKSKLSRRSMVVGAGAVGAAAAAVTLLPQAVPQDEPAQAKQPPKRGGGYQLTDHVKQYYKTTLI